MSRADSLGRVLQALLSAAACALLGRALVFSYGTHDARALLCVLAAGLCGTMAVAPPGRRDRRVVAPRWAALPATALAALTVYHITVAFAVWDPKSFWFDMVGLHLLHPFRPDASSLLAL